MPIKHASKYKYNRMQYKQTRFSVTVKTVTLFLLCGGLLASCLPSSPGRSHGGDRKKMLNLDDATGDWEGYSLTAPEAQHGAIPSPALGAIPGTQQSAATQPGTDQPGAPAFPPLPFALSDTLLQRGAAIQTYMLLRLSSADYDFLLLGAKNYEAWLPVWLKSWPQTGREGLIIDLSAGKATSQIAFQLTAPGVDNPVPLVLLWDAPAEKRAGFYSQLLQGLTTIRCESLSQSQNQSPSQSPETDH